MALAMVDSNQLTVVRPSFGVSAPGGGRLAELRRHEQSNAPVGKDQLRFALKLTLSQKRQVCVGARDVFDPSAKSDA
jgi:hypothetical protein